jgi:glycyl-tRNA synthetase beta subunit
MIAFCIEAEITKDVLNEVPKSFKPKKVTIWLSRLCPCHFERPVSDGLIVMKGKLISMNSEGIMVVTLTEGKKNLETEEIEYPWFYIKDTSILMCWNN